MFPILINGNWLTYFVVKSYKIYKVEIQVVFKNYWFCEVTQSCPTLCDPTDCSLPGSSICGIFQARIMEWVAISFSRGSSRPRDWTWVSSIADRCFTVWATREAHMYTYIQRERGRGREEGQRDRERESCMTCLHSLEINPLLLALFANIFSDSEGGLSSGL